MTENFKKIAAPADAPRFELHDALQLTGCELSINRLAAGAAVPFVHAHKANEEIYFILSGKGKVEIDGQSVDLVEGDWLRIAPEGRRRIFASPDSPIGFICIQVKAGSLGAYTADDALA